MGKSSVDEPEISQAPERAGFCVQLNPSLPTDHSRIMMMLGFNLVFRLIRSHPLSSPGASKISSLIADPRDCSVDRPD